MVIESGRRMTGKAPPRWAGFVGIGLGVAIGGGISQAISQDHPRWQGILAGSLVAAAAAIGVLGLIHVFQKRRRR